MFCNSSWAFAKQSADLSSVFMLSLRADFKNGIYPFSALDAQQERDCAEKNRQVA